MASPHTARDPVDLFSEFQHHIEEMLNEGHTNPQVVAALTRLGFKTSIRSLQRFLKSSDLHRPSGAVWWCFGSDPGPTTAIATAIPPAGTHKRQISGAIPRDERPNGPETTPAAPPQQEAQGSSQEAQTADIAAGHRWWRRQ